MSDIPTPLTFVDPAVSFSTFNVVLYGPGGSGKTIGATSVNGGVLALNAEGPGGLAKARSLGRDIREVQFTGQGVLRPFCEYVKAGADGASTVVVDTVGKLYARIIKELGGGNPKIQHYGQANTIIADLITFLRDQPVNVVFVCHEKIDDSDGERIVRPLTGGQQLPEILIGEVDVVGYCNEVPAQEDKPKRWVAQLTQDRGRRAKDRCGDLGPYRDIDLGEWLTVYGQAMRAKDAPPPDNSDLPFDPDADEETATTDVVDAGTLQDATA